MSNHALTYPHFARIMHYRHSIFIFLLLREWIFITIIVRSDFTYLTYMRGNKLNQVRFCKARRQTF